MKDIFYTIQPDWEELYTACGSPIWIFCSVVELAAFKAIADSYELNLVEYTLSTKTFKNCPKSEELVVSFNLNDTHIAHQYAHLTNRRGIYVDNLSVLNNLTNVSVIIIRAEDFRAELIDILCNPGGVTVPGLIMASDETVLSFVVKRYALGYLYEGIEEVRSTYITEFQVDHETIELFNCVVDSMSDQETLNGAIFGEVDFFSIKGHSDGIHVSLPAQKMLCPLLVDRYPAPSINNPYCIVKQCCPRYLNRPTIKDAFQSKKLISPESINSKVIFNNSCFSFRVDDKTLCPSYTLANALSERSRSISVIGSFNTILSSCDSDKFVFRLLREGHSVGEAVSLHNRALGERSGGGKLIFLGDPQVRIVSNVAKSRELPDVCVDVTSDTNRKYPNFSSAEDKIFFINACVEHLIDNNLHCDVSAAEKVLKLLSACRASGSFVGLGGDLGLYTLETFACANRINDAWSSFSQIFGSEVNAKCKMCGNPSIIFNILLDTGGERISQHCPMCDEVYNIPQECIVDNASVKISVEKGFLIVAGLHKDSSLLLSIVNRNIDDRVDSPDFFYDNINNAFILDLSKIDPPAGPLIFRILFYFEFNFGYYSFKGRYRKNSLDTYTITGC